MLFYTFKLNRCKVTCERKPFHCPATKCTMWALTFPGANCWSWKECYLGRRNDTNSHIESSTAAVNNDKVKTLYCKLYERYHQKNEFLFFVFVAFFILIPSLFICSLHLNTWVGWCSQGTMWLCNFRNVYFTGIFLRLFSPGTFPLTLFCISSTTICCL